MKVGDIILVLVKTLIVFSLNKKWLAWTWMELFSRESEKCLLPATNASFSGTEFILKGHNIKQSNLTEEVIFFFSDSKLQDMLNA